LHLRLLAAIDNALQLIKLLHVLVDVEAKGHWIYIHIVLWLMVLLHVLEVVKPKLCHLLGRFKVQHIVHVLILLVHEKLV